MDELLYAIKTGRLSRNTRTHAVILHCFNGIRFDQWHMLMRRRMEQNLRTVSLKHSRKPLRICDIPDQRNNWEGIFLIIKFLMDIVETVLVTLIQ